jgi:hypothetical protein
MSRRVAVIRIDVPAERIAFIIKVTAIGELGTTLAVTGNRNTLQRISLSHSISSQRASAASYC